MDITRWSIHWDAIVAIGMFVGVFIEITPIPVSPLKWLGKRLNQDINSRLTEHIAEDDKHNMQDKRSKILVFATKCRNQCKMSREEFANIVEINIEYHRLIAKHKFTNGMVDNAMITIEKYRQECEKNDFFLK